MIERKFKVIIAGEPGAGKSIIASAADLCRPFKPYGVSIGKKFKTLDAIESNITLMLWTLTTGRPKDSTYMQGTHAGIVIGNLKKPETVKKMRKWANILLEGAGDIPLIFVGNGNPYEEEDIANRMAKIADSFGSLHLFIEETNRHSIEEVFTSVSEILGYLTIYDELMDMKIEEF